MEKTTEKKNHKIINFLKEYVPIVVGALVLALLINNFVIVNATIPTGSMENTIQIKDKIIGFRQAYLFSEPERNDIVIFKYPDNEKELFIKRVIGLPGETVEIIDGKVYIDGAEKPLPDLYIKEPMVGNFGPYKVPKGCYFMMGDNRNESLDSRYWNNTYVKKEKIIGKAIFRYSPDFKN